MGSAVEIAGLCRLDLARMIREEDLRVGVEVGVATGEFSKIILSINPQLTLYGVDPYKVYPGYKDFTNPSSLRVMEKEAHRRLDGFRHFRFKKKFSIEASKDFKDKCLDFVYIDANHEEDFVYDDLTHWTPKVRPGGFMSGHDYVAMYSAGNEGERYLYGVKNAVYGFTQEHDLDLQILGAKEKTPKVVRDNIRSWMFRV